MTSKFLIRYAGLFSFMLLLGACASTGGGQRDAASYADEIEQLNQRILANPQDAEAYRELGIIYLETSNYPKANENLQAAFRRNTTDPRTIYHLGLVNEVLGKRQTALRLYEGYRDLPRRSTYRRKMEGRYEWVTRQIALEDVQNLIDQEEALTTERLVPRAVAVFPFTYQGSEERFAPLGRGLSEMVTVDLTNVRGLQLIERIRLKALQDELALSQTAYADPSSAPRVGKLLAAGRLVGGVYNVLGGENLRLDATLWDQERPSAPSLQSESGLLRNFFRVEKELVFGLIEEMGIELTEEERQRIERIPTENLQAFLAFSRGLENEDAGAYGEAAAQFREAARLDPNFEQATDRAETNEGLSEVGMNVMTLIAMTRPEPGPVTDQTQRQGQTQAQNTSGTGSVDPVRNRLMNLNSTLGVSFVPGEEAREPAGEVGTAGGTLGNGLPDPPPPPPRGQ